jgi:hypothetical protein
MTIFTETGPNKFLTRAKLKSSSNSIGNHSFVDSDQATMATETLTHQNGVVPNGDHVTNSATVKKSRESERRRRRRKQKKINKASKELKANASDDDNDTKPEPQQVLMFLLVLWLILVWLG